MLTIHPDGSHSLIGNGHTESAVLEYQHHFSSLDPLPKLLADRPDGRAIVLDTTIHPAYLAQRELSNDYLRPHGIDHVIDRHAQIGLRPEQVGIRAEGHRRFQLSHR